MVISKGFRALPGTNFPLFFLDSDNLLNRNLCPLKSAFVFPREKSKISDQGDGKPLFHQTPVLQS